MTDSTKLQLKPYEPANSLERRMTKLFNDEKYCDITIKAPGCDIKAHNAVVCSISPVIARALDSDFMESQKACYNMGQESYEVVSRFVQYCYQSSYDTIRIADPVGQNLVVQSQQDSRREADPALVAQDERQSRTESRDSGESFESMLISQRMLLDVDMYRMGDMYDVSSLKLFAHKMLDDRLEQHWMHDGSAGPFLNLIAPIYDCTTDDDPYLRNLVVKYMRRFRKAISSEEPLRTRMQTLARSIDNFLAVMVDDDLDAPHYDC